MQTAPYFVYPALKALRAVPAPQPEEAMRLRRLIAANVGDIPSLRIILNLDPAEFASFYPDMEAPDLDTCGTIDSFLTRFGNPGAPTPRAAQEIPSPQAPEPEPNEADMRHAVKNHDYQKALQIIERLNLINPQKSVYFADQMRFLRKLILIQNSANN